jgi:ribosomal protein L18
MNSKIDKNTVRKARSITACAATSSHTRAAQAECIPQPEPIYAQVINDEIGNTLVAASTLDASIKAQLD